MCHAHVYSGSTYKFDMSQVSEQEVFNGYLNSHTPSIKHPDDLVKSYKESFHDIRRLLRWKNLDYVHVTPSHLRQNNTYTQTKV